MTVGLIASAFDLLHPGHLIALSQCLKELTGGNDTLILALHSDPSIERPEKNKPIQTTFERWLQLRHSFVGMSPNVYIIPYDTEQDLRAILISFNVNLRFLGDDYKDKPYTGDDLFHEVVWLDRSHGYSTSQLRKRILNTAYGNSITTLNGTY